MQERARAAPVALERALRAAGYLGDLGQVEPGEEAHLHEPGQVRIEFGEMAQRLVQRQHIGIALDAAGIGLGLVERLRGMAAAALGRGAMTRMVHLQLAHRARRHGEEVLAIDELQGVGPGEAEVRLMDQRGGLHAVAAPARDLALRDPV